MDLATRAPVAGPTFIRLLARVVDAAVEPSGAAPSARLGQWIDWTRAVALSRALDRPLDAPPPAQRGDDPAAEVAGVRHALAARIADPEAWARALPPDPADDTGFAAARKHYASLQHAMQAGTGRLRGALRDRLAAGTPSQARLAELDAVMEQIASPREQQLLASVPALLAERYDRLHHQGGPARDGGDLLATAAPETAWSDGFRQDLQQLLQAELELRFMPLDGLLAALRNP